MQENEKHIDFDLISKVLSGNAEPNEIEQVQNWRNESEANELEFVALKKLFLPETDVQFDVDAAWNRVKNKTLEVGEEKEHGRSPILRYALRAAVFIGLLAVAYLVFYPFNAKTVLTADGSNKVLPDNSSISLEEGATLAYSKGSFNENERRVELKGSAFFDIAKNPEKPFVIETGQGNIRVLGTSFQVLDSVNSFLVVKVTSGKVRVNDNKGDSVELIAGQRTRISGGKLEKTVSFNTNELFNQTKALVFRNTRLNIVFKTLSRSYKVDIQFDVEKVKSCRQNARFEDMEIEEILDIICETHELTYTVKDKRYVISGEGC